MTSLTYHVGARGVPGFLIGITGSDGVTRQTVVPAVAMIDPSTGSAVGEGTGSSSTPISGSFGATGQSALFTALPNRDIWVKLSGTFVATVQVERCSDGTTGTAMMLTVGGTQWAVFTAPAQEAVASESDSGVAYRLNCTSYTSGTATYQLGHK